ncbi:MAG TPA: hypothetical protein VFD69_13985 [Vicinamibacterales bacterium]|nr:hypothetical protein [Vicinamibacterales bacterium]
MARRVVLAVALACVVAGLQTRLDAQEARELTVSGCLLSNGYAGYQVEDAVLDAVNGTPAEGKTKAVAPAKWILDGGGNLRRRVGEKVQVVGKSEWRADDKDQAPGTPHLEVTSVTTLAASCK